MPEISARAWRVAARSELVWRFWDGEYVVFHVSSGDTHLLNLVAGQALQSLEHAPADAAELTRRVAAALDVEPDDALRDDLVTFLAQLEDLGLIEPAVE